MGNKKIVILTVSVGEGHDQISRALQEELKEWGHHAEIVDILQYMSGSSAEFLKRIYFTLIYSIPSLWEFIFKLTSRPNFLFKLDFIVSYLWKDLFDLFKKKKFQVIVTTHPLATYLGGKIKESSAKKQELFAILSDFSTHKMSLSHSLDALFIARKEEKQSLSKFVEDRPIFPYGIPLRSVWDEKENKRVLRRNANLPLYERVIVISGGKEGITSHEELLKILERDKKASHIVWFLGVDDGVGRLDFFLENGSCIQYMPFSKEYHQYVKAADLLIAKPGGVTMAEAVRFGIPTGIYSPLPGQEKLNEEILCRRYLRMKSVRKDFVPSDFISACRSEVKESSLMKESRKKIVNEIMKLSQMSYLGKRLSEEYEDGRHSIFSLDKNQETSS